MKKSEYLERLQYENKKHIDNIYTLIRILDFKIERLKHSKAITDGICERFDIRCYNYNLVNEIQKSKLEFTKNLDSLIKQINKIVSRKSRNIDYDIQRVISINDLLYTYEVQLNTINKNDLSNVENLQLNAIKKEIYEKYMKIRADIDRCILKEKFEKMQNRSSFMKAIDSFFVLTEFVGKQRENLFVAIQGIDDCEAKFVEGSEPKREYKIVDIIADIEIYLCENRKSRKYKVKYRELIDLKDKINSTFSIEKKELKLAIDKKYKSKLPMPVEKNVSKMKRRQQRAIEFLYKSGYIKNYQHVEYKSKMDILIDKIKLLSENVEREINR